MPFYFLPGKSQSGLDIPLNQELIEKGELLFLLSLLLCSFIAFFYLALAPVWSVTEEYNKSLVFSPDDSRLFYSVREPIVNRVFSSSRQRGFATKSVVITSLRQSTTSMSLCCNWSLWSFCFFFFFSAFRLCVRSRCWDACMVVDGGTSFEFNDGAIATISMSEEDQLRTVVLENWDKSEYLSS